jgi:hypothetical protein
MSKAKSAALRKVDYVSKQEAVAAPAARVEVAPEQLRYANLLLYGAWSGIAYLMVSFVLYMTGILSAFVPPQEISKYWGMKVSQYIAATGAPHGWGWLKMAGHGDYLCLVGVAFLGGLTVIGYLNLLPAYLAKKDIPYSVIVALEITILVLAASGIFGNVAG